MCVMFRTDPDSVGPPDRVRMDENLHSEDSFGHNRYNFRRRAALKRGRLS